MSALAVGVIIIILMFGLLLYGGYTNGWFYLAAKSIGINTDLPTGIPPNPNIVTIKESDQKTGSSEYSSSTTNTCVASMMPPSSKKLIVSRYFTNN